MFLRIEVDDLDPAWQTYNAQAEALLRTGGVMVYPSSALMDVTFVHGYETFRLSMTCSFVGVALFLVLSDEGYHFMQKM